MHVWLLLSLVGATYSIRFFDSCPSRRTSIGACLAGLCPAGSECINGYCCKLKPTTTTTIATTTTTTMPLTSTETEISTEESEEIGRYTCTSGRPAIGECISGSCPKGFKCEDDLCCSKALPSVTVTMIPVIKEITKKMGTTMRPSTAIPEGEESEENEIESIKNSFLKKGGIDGDSNSIETTTVGEEEDYEETDEGPGPTSTTTTSTTPTPPASTTSRRRFKTRKPFTTTPEPEDEEHWTETIMTETPRTTLLTTTTTLIPEIDTGCPVGEPIGECISNQCPEGHACFQNSCCILTPQINCTDVLMGCMPHLCNKRGYKEFMTKSCPRSCARCHLVDLGVTEISECRDRRSDCAEWAAEGFCDSTLYSTRQKLKFCGKSCKLC